MASLANQTISSTYDGLIKTSTDAPVGVSGVQLLEDGSGNSLALSVGRANNGVTITGNLAVDTNTLYVDAANNRVGVGVVPESLLSVGANLNNSLTFTYNFNVQDALIHGVGSGESNMYLHRDDVTISSGDVLGNINFSGADGGSYIGAKIKGVAAGSWSATNAMSDLVFETTQNGGTSPTERMRIDSSGRVSINDTVSGSVATNYNPELLVGGNIVARSLTANEALIEIGGDATSAFITAAKQDGSQTARALRFEVGTSEAMRITSGGDVLIGTTGVPNGTSIYGAGFQNASAERSILYTATNITSSAALMYFANPNGFIGNITVNGSTTSFNSTSDYRLKENVVEMTGALDRVDALKPSRFNYILDPEKTVDGFLAHEVAEVVPEAVTGEKDAVNEEGNPIYQGIDQSKIVPLLVGAIKELSAKVAALESQLNA